MDESKQRELINSSLTCVEDKIILDSLNRQLKIQEIFVERKWRSISKNVIRPIQGYQLIIVLTDTIPDEYSFDWMLRVSQGKLFSALDNKLLYVDMGVNELELEEEIKVTIY